MKFAWYLYIQSNAFATFPMETKLWRALLFRDEHNAGRPLTNWPAAIRRPYKGEGLLDESMDRDDFAWPVNLSEMNVTHAGGSKLNVHLESYCPNFSHFQARIGKGAWRRLKAAECDWPLKAGTNRIAARAVNTLGVAGHESFVELDLEAAMSIKLLTVNLAVAAPG